MPENQNTCNVYAYSYTCPDCMDEFYISFHTKPRIGCTFTCDCGRDVKYTRLKSCASGA